MEPAQAPSFVRRPGVRVRRPPKGLHRRIPPPLSFEDPEEPETRAEGGALFAPAPAREPAPEPSTGVTLPSRGHSSRLHGRARWLAAAERELVLALLLGMSLAAAAFLAAGDLSPLDTLLVLATLASGAALLAFGALLGRRGRPDRS